MQKENNSLRQEFEALLENSADPPKPEPRSTVTGKVIKQTRNGYFVDIGARCESFVSTDDAQELWLGCEYSFHVTGPADEDGAVPLSRKATLIWEEMETMRQLETVTLVKISSLSRSRAGRPCGLNCTISGIKGFIPRSEIPQRQNLTDLINEEIPVTVLNPDMKQEPDGVVILSHKKALDLIFMTQIEQFSPSQTVSCRVVSLAKNGVRVRISNGLSAFIPSGELEYDRRAIPSQVLQVGDQLEAQILKLDSQNQSIILSRRTHLQNQFLNQVKPGQKLEGKIARLSNFAIFVQVGDCLDAVLYRKDSSKSQFQPGQTIEATVMRVNPKEGKLVLGKNVRILNGGLSA